ncbi:MAG TPA: hypothetical protein VIE68_09130 [Gemmatimonadota bacterium]|jgi:hypothetical protein
MSETMRECPREAESLSALLAGSVGAELKRHVTGCAECREVMIVATWLRGVASETEFGPLPGADRVRWRAQVERRLEARRSLAERAARPIRWFERGAAASIAIVAAGILRTYALPTADTVLAQLSDPATLATVTATLMVVAGLAARESLRRP